MQELIRKALEANLELLKGVPTREEFAIAFKAAADSINRAKADLTAQIQARLATLKDGERGPKGEKGDKGDPGKTFIALRGKQGEPGKDANPADVVPLVLAQLPPPVEETAVETRDKLETLEGDERLDKSAVKGIDEIEKSIKEIAIRPTGGYAGRSLLQLYVDGAKKGAVQYVNIVGGSGISLSYNRANGRNDITISATGSVSLTPIAVSGTIDDSNTSFVAASAPNLVMINGAAYRDGHGVSISGSNITTDAPVGTGGDIYCL